MPYTEILYAVAEHIATITLNRPEKLNAWTFTMEKEVREAVEAAEQDPGVRAIVLTGAGRGFCAGMDMGQLGQLAGTRPIVTQLRESLADYVKGPRRDGVRADFQKTYSYFPAIGKPVIAALNGVTTGLGLVIALYCDVRFASDQAKLSTAFARRGLIAEHGLSWMLPRLVGHAHALDLLLSARTIDAAEALRIGLVNAVFPRDRLMESVRAYAVELATMVSPRSLRVIKRQVYDALFQTLAEATDAANEEMFQSFVSDDFREGVAHFLEKRPPAFTGK
jgi:enoyl-CoA hydratase/carnithine racemase